MKPFASHLPQPFPENRPLWRPPEWERGGRRPLWTDLELLFAAGARDTLSEYQAREAVILAPDEKLAPVGGRSQLVNHYFLRAGHPARLAEAWLDFYIEIGRIYGFTRAHNWIRQRGAFRELFQKVFRSRVLGCVPVGWVSLLTAQRPQFLRNWEDSRIEMHTEKIAVAAAGRPLHQPLTVHDVIYIETAFSYAADRQRTPTRLRNLILFRKLKAGGFVRGIKRYREWRWVPAVDGMHDSLLRQGGMPSLVDYYPQESLFDRRLGTTGYLNLCQAVISADGTASLCDTTLEIDPRSGRIVSVRGFQIPLVAGIVGASVVEHVALSQAIREIGEGSRN